MVDTRFTDLEYPLIEFNVEGELTTEQLLAFKKNCLADMEDLNIFNIAFDFKTKDSLTRYLGSFSDGLSDQVQGLLRFDLNLIQYFTRLDFEEIKRYSDVIININSDQLLDYGKLKELESISEVKPILRITYSCDWETTQQLYKTLDYLEELDVIKYIIINPDYKTDLDFKAFLDLQKLNLRGKRKHRTFFDRGSLPASILRAHPCNAYILSCANCHYGKKDIPRSFIIYSDGFIYPEGLSNQFPTFMIGNIFENSLSSLLSDYWLSKNHQVFKEACERVFHDYVLDFPFGLVPWRYLFYKEAQGLIG